jgi:hypothetical protein
MLSRVPDLPQLMFFLAETLSASVLLSIRKNFASIFKMSKFSRHMQLMTSQFVIGLFTEGRFYICLNIPNPIGLIIQII